jgi:hypothetical protein
MKNRWIIVGAAVAMSLAACSPSGPKEAVHGLETGTDYDARQQRLIGQSNSFAVGQRAYVVFTVDTKAAGSTAQVTLLRGGALEDTSLPIALDKGEHVYEKSIILAQPGSVTIQVSYDGTVEAATRVSVG